MHELAGGTSAEREGVDLSNMKESNPSSIRSSCEREISSIDGTKVRGPSGLKS